MTMHTLAAVARVAAERAAFQADEQAGPLELVPEGDLPAVWELALGSWHLLRGTSQLPRLVDPIFDLGTSSKSSEYLA
jgi:hypothetical protein